MRRLAALAATVLAAAVLAAPSAHASDAVTVQQLDGSTQPLAFDLAVPFTPYKLVVDGVYAGKDLTENPAHISVAAAGDHKLRVDGATRYDARWTAVTSSAPAPTPTPAPSPTSSTPAAPAPAPSPTDSAPPVVTGEVHVSDVAGLVDALADSAPGTVIDLADGVYLNHKGDRFAASASGTAAAPITLRGSRAAILESDSVGGDYGLHITGSYWRVEGITVQQATKGIVLDGSVGTVLDGVEVRGVGQEGIHFRACSADGVLRNSYVHDTGLRSPQYGEGVYVGSANSNWAKYSCTDGHDNSEHVLIEGNTFRRIAAEGADLKEGTDSGQLLDNVFDDTGYSGENSADSAVDVKGNGWTVAGNTVENPQGADLDGIQTHSVYNGYGYGNTISGNRIVGAWPGFGIGQYPGGNTVTCDNTAPDAALGLVGANSHPTTCAG